MHIDEAAHFTFICGEDEFLVAEEGRAWFLRATKGIQEELSKEVIDGRAGKVEEVSLILDRFAEAVQTQSLFGEQKVVWLKSINFIANSQTGNAKGTLDLPYLFLCILIKHSPLSTIDLTANLSTSLKQRTPFISQLSRLPHLLHSFSISSLVLTSNLPF